MPRRDWDTLDALIKSPKAKLHYDNGDINEEEFRSRSMCMLSPYAVWLLDNRRSPVETQLSSNKIPIGLGGQEPKVATDSPFTDLPITELPDCSSDLTNDKMLQDLCKKEESSLILQSPRLTEIEGSISLYEKAERMRVQNELQKRLEMFVQREKYFADQANEQLKRFEEMMELKQRQERNRIQEQLEQSSKEALGQQEKLKEEHRTRAKLLNRKLREAEQQRQEQERIRQEEGRERKRRLCALQQEVLQLVQQIEVDYKHQETVDQDLQSYSQRGNQICTIFSNVVRDSENSFPTQEDVQLGECYVQEMQSLVSHMQKKRKEAEEAAARERQKVAETQQPIKDEMPPPLPTKKQPQTAGLREKCAPSLMKKHQLLQSTCEQCLNNITQFTNSKDPQVKSIKAGLQKAVSIPVSQISATSGSRLRNIFDKLNNLLSGNQVTSVGRSVVSVSQHPQALEFVCFKLAEKFVNQGEEEIASHHEAAFPIAAVASGIWERHPKVGELLLAHLYKKCPYALPFYPSYKEGTPLQEYQRMLGYQVEDSQVEPQNNFLKRISGMIRLYAAIIQLRWPYNNQQEVHPHGLNYGWQWMAQLLNMEPLVDITSTLLYDFLEVCGNALMRTYQGQFWKLLMLIKDEYLPRIEKVSALEQMGSVTRLRLFLEDSIKKKEIPLPKGFLSPSFWRS
ncbi:hypothetical protein GDO86_015186 [Hymenochirus boettgeri]|uniref:mRNA export factor GLE1 n=1 Tax=Hymenochirus boettgeri TaxID=247094 RepID=A0A8T2JVM6_9PIPI|nr:hypothetical protein GDO86_015186 [Hymenochirus boettgeri]